MASEPRTRLDTIIEQLEGEREDLLAQVRQIDEALAAMKPSPAHIDPVLDLKISGEAKKPITIEIPHSGPYTVHDLETLEFRKAPRVRRTEKEMEDADRLFLAILMLRGGTATTTEIGESIKRFGTNSTLVYERNLRTHRDRLERKGHITIDPRYMIMTLTPEGTRIAREYGATIGATVDHLGNPIPSKETA